MSAPSVLAQHASRFTSDNYPGLRRRLIRFFEWHGVSEPDDEVCADETIFRVVRRQAGGELIDDYDAYALGIAHNVLNEYRRQNARRPLPLDERIAEPVAAEPPPDSWPALSRALQSLPARDRKLVTEYYTSEDPIRTRQRHAKKLGITRNALYGRILRIRRRLVEVLKAEGIEGIEE